MILIRNVYLFGYAGFSFFIFLFFRDKNPSATLINHERIHFFQQLELLFVLHWVLYLLNYSWHFIRLLLSKKSSFAHCHDAAYRAICFEREAYRHENDTDYLKKRKPFAWIKYL